MYFNKKGAELSLNVIIIAIIVSIVLIVTIAIFSGNIGKSSSILHQNINTLKHDCDGDGIEDAMDKCPCDYNEKSEPLPNECKISNDECQKMINEKNCPIDKKIKSR